MSGDEVGFVNILEHHIRHKDHLELLVTNKKMHVFGNNIMHMAVLNYLQKPFFLKYLLATEMPLNVENDEGMLPWFQLKSFTDDKLFEQIFLEFMKQRPREFNLNYQSVKAKSVTGDKRHGVTLLHLILEKCPSLFKVKLFIDFEYDFQREANMIDKIIRLLNKSHFQDCSYDEKTQIVEKVYQVTEVKRKLVFLKVYEVARQTTKNTSHSNRFLQSLG